jgi:hypothetical protein
MSVSMFCRDAMSISVARGVEGVRPRVAKSVSVAHELEGMLHRDAESASAARDAKSVSAAHEVDGVLRRDAKRVSFAHDAKSVSSEITAVHEVKGVLRHDAMSVSVAREVEGVLPRGAKSVSVAHEVEGVLRRDAKSVSFAHEVEGVLPREAKSVSVARDAEIASVEVEGELRRDAKSVSVAHEAEGVLLRDAKSVSVARDVEIASVAHEVEGVLRRDAKSVDPVIVHATRELAISTVNDALFDLMVSWDFDGVCDTVKMVHCSGGSLSPDVQRKVRSWALLYDDVCKCMERLDSLHDDLLDLISVGRVLLSGDAVQGEVSRAEGLQACGHGDCGSLRRELAEACCEIKCATCGHDFVPGICVETAWFRPVVFTRGWSCGTEFKTVGHFLWDPPCPEKGEAIRCPDCVSA